MKNLTKLAFAVSLAFAAAPFAATAGSLEDSRMESGVKFGESYINGGGTADTPVTVSDDNNGGSDKTPRAAVTASALKVNAVPPVPKSDASSGVDPDLRRQMAPLLTVIYILGAIIVPATIGYIVGAGIAAWLGAAAAGIKTAGAIGAVVGVIRGKQWFEQKPEGF